VQPRIGFCVDCLRQHLDARLEQYGRRRCDQIACPWPGCDRRLEYDEIRLYARPETFAKYDTYLNINQLSNDPNFRWYLGPGCSGGQVYEGAVGPLVWCADCAFEMCFKHGVPWHVGRSCDEFEQDGDPSYRQTQEWVLRNTKPCPACGLRIQKGEACFHMTCRFIFKSLCRHGKTGRYSTLGTIPYHTLPYLPGLLLTILTIP